MHTNEIDITANLFFNTTDAAERTATEAKLLRLVDNYVVRITTKILTRCADPDQLQEARLAALIALRSYNPCKASYRTWVYWHVRKALYRKTLNAIDLPEFMMCYLRRLQDFEADWLQSHDLPPDDTDILAALKFSASVLLSLRRAQAHQVLPIDDAAAFVAEDPAFEVATVQVDVQSALAALAVEDPLAAKVARAYYIDDIGLDAISRRFLCGNYKAAQATLDIAKNYLRTTLAGYN